MRTNMIDSPRRKLLFIFVAWKLLILSIAYSSPGIGYDTSASLLAQLDARPTESQDLPVNLRHSYLKLLRWDAIYYTETARRGHLFEQEWAFGKGVSTMLSLVVRFLNPDSIEDNASYVLAGTVISHVAHLSSVLTLFPVADMLQGSKRSSSSSTSFVAAVLHILSPAGIFLSAPYSESSFACLNMLGFYLYAKSACQTAPSSIVRQSMYKLLSGALFGCATMIRSNGILSGIPFLLDAIETILDLVNPRVDLFAKSTLLVQLQITVLSGCCVAFGMAWPQFLAYREYCTSDSLARQWCSSWLPSIFSFVQEHYWNVGFLRYWTVSNLPLFLLATPCLYLLIVSGLEGVRLSLTRPKTPSGMDKLQLRIALPQLLLALLAVTNYHVQVITRLSSGYPFWYFWLASRVNDWEHFGVTIRVLVMYALIQAGLFACFLPPA